MGILRKAVSDSIKGDARRSWDEGHSRLVVQVRPDGDLTMTKLAAGAAEKIEAVEEVGWELDRFTAVAHANTATLILLYKRPAVGRGGAADQPLEA